MNLLNVLRFQTICLDHLVYAVRPLLESQAYLSDPQLMLHSKLLQSCPTL